MRVDRLASSEPTFSFEFFPPKTEAGDENLRTALAELRGLDPSFVSVTYGAGGSTRIAPCSGRPQGVRAGHPAGAAMTELTSFIQLVRVGSRTTIPPLASPSLAHATWRGAMESVA